MVWSKLLLTLSVIAGLTLSSAEVAYANPGTCNSGAGVFGGCPPGASIHGNHVTISAGTHKTTPGTSDTPATRTRATQPRGSSAVAPRVAPARGCLTFLPCGILTLDPKAPKKPAKGTPPGAATTVTIADLVNFAPTAGVDHVQPDGWAVIGLATNFYSTGGASIDSGELLGQRAQVAFTPIAWTWTYGDGERTVSATPGASWASLGIPDFDPTATSHSYSRKGDFTARLTITYAAAYRYGGGAWSAVIGTLDVPSVPLAITADDAKTVLVGRDCTVNPKGPGC